MLSVPCVLAINDNLCVYIHEQAIVETAYPGGVKTLLYLKHPIFRHSIHNRCLNHVPLVSLLDYNLQTSSRYYSLPLQCNFWRKFVQIKKKKKKQKEENRNNISNKVVWYIEAKLWICITLKKVPAWPVSNQIVMGGA